MKKLIYILLMILPSVCLSQQFDQYFIDKTLRIDYTFSGNHQAQTISLDQLSELPKWAGRKHNLSRSFQDGNGQIYVYDLVSNGLIYKNTFSSLFQEWITTDEAQTVSKSFENTFLIPMPKEKVRVEVHFREKDGSSKPLIAHVVDPKDILIRKKGYENITPHTLIHKGDSNKKSINVAIVAEGYTREEMAKFRQYASETVNHIFSHAPFDRHKNDFNFYAIESPSIDAGVSVPRKNIWKETAVESHFDTFYSDRYLTTSRVKKIHDLLAGIPYEHIIILANTDVYGGGGIFNSYTLTTTGHTNFKPVVVHEFGHSFAGLADEYYYESDALDNTYDTNVEPWESNITTLKNFDSKWKDMLEPNTPIPTDVVDAEKYKVGVYEGGGYKSKGIYRSKTDCRMKTNTSKEFCPVCQRTIERLIRFYTE